MKESLSTEMEYEKPVWSYADSYGPSHLLRAYPGIQRTYLALQGTSDEWYGQHEQASAVDRRLKPVFAPAKALRDRSGPRV